MVLDAARQVFTERGFAGARTREIAGRADVTEKVMFRHFPSKADLFRAAVFEPFQLVADAYLAEFDQRARLGLDVRTLATHYVSGLYTFLRANGAHILSLLAAYAHDPDVLGGAGPGPLDRLMGELEKAVEAGVAEHGTGPVDARLTVRLTFGMVLSAAVTNALLLGDGAEDEDTLLEEMVSYVVAGVLRRDPGGVSQD